MSYLVNYLNSSEFIPQFNQNSNEYQNDEIQNSNENEKDEEIQKLKEQLEAKQNSIDFLKLQLKKAQEDSKNNNHQNMLLKEAEVALNSSVKQTSKLIETVNLLESELRLQHEIKQKNQERINKLTQLQENKEQEIKLLKAQNAIFREQVEEQEKGIQDGLFQPVYHSQKKTIPKTPKSPKSDTDEDKIKNHLTQLKQLQELMDKHQNRSVDTSKHVQVNELMSNLNSN